MCRLSRMLRSALVAAAVAGPVSAQSLDPTADTARTVGFDATRLDRLDSVLRGYVDRGELPGVSVLIARHGKIAYLKSFGMRDIESAKPMQGDTIVRLYSMSKPITAAAAMIAYEDGKFRLSDPIAKYIPELSQMSVYADGIGDAIKTVPAKHPILVENLLTHTAGFTFSFQFGTPVAELYRKAGLNAGLWFYDPSMHGLDDFARRLAKLPLVHEPGEQWHYGTGLDVAALVIERTERERFDKFVKERIFDPLGMSDTGFFVPHNKVDRFAASYVRGPNGRLKLIDAPQTSPFVRPPFVMTGSGGLQSTIGDFFKFAQMLCNGGVWNGKRILSPAAVDLMMGDHLRPDQLGQLASTATFGFGGAGGGMNFGYGGAVIDDPAKTQGFGSPGLYTWGGAASTTFFVDRRRDIVAVLMTQLTPSGTYPLSDDLKAMVYQALVEPSR